MFSRSAHFDHRYNLRLWLVLAIGAGMFSLASVSAQSKAPRTAISAAEEASFERAMHLLEAGDSQGAKPLLEALHQRLPHNYEISESLGLLYAGTGDLHTALPLLQAGAREAPQAAVAHANLGTALVKLGQTAEATAELQRAADLNPVDRQTQNNLGQVLMLTKQPCRAAAAFAAANDPSDANLDLAYNRALALFDCGRPSEAQQVLENAPATGTSAAAQSLLGDIDEAAKQYKDAADHYLHATQIDPSQANIYTFGLDLLRHWSFDPAIETFSTGLKRYPDSERLLSGLGIAYYGAAKYNEAIRVFSQLLQSEPDNVLYGEIYGRSCTVLTDNPSDLCSHLLELAQTHPANINLGLYAAIAILHQPDDPAKLATAQTLLEGVVKSTPHLAEAHYQLGVLLQRQEHWPESIPELQLALAQDPTLARAHYRLGLAYNRTGRKAEAQQQMALDRDEDKQQRNDLNARMQQITTILVNLHK